MTPKANPVASIRARLLNKAKADGVEFELMLTRFALERLLYRLSVSPYRDQLLLKGALLFDVWFDEPRRPTRDADFLGFGPADPERLAGMFRDICAIHADDGISFDPGSVVAAEIRRTASYPGVRVTLVGNLDGARCPAQADIGFGDAVTAAPEEVDYPTLLADLPPARLRVYPRYTVIAEKFEAIVSLGIANSRMKDFFDLWLLIRETDINAVLLTEALAATFRRRGTPLPPANAVPVGLSDDFATDSGKVRQWATFISRNRLEAPALQEVIVPLRNTFDSATRGLR